MFLDVLDLRNFYSQPLGRVTAHYINQRIRGLWPNVKGLSILGVGYPPPYLRGMRNGADRTLAFMPSRQGAVYWPSNGSSLTALVECNQLPLADASIDRIVLVHMLELVDNPAEHLREIWRVLTPGGRLLIVVPNRRGVWARLEHSPFAYGRPFSRGQLTHLLRDTMFTPTRWNDGLFFAPFKRERFFGSAHLWERVGAQFWPAFSGVLIVEATKLMAQGLVTKESQMVKASFRPVFLPVPNLPASVHHYSSRFPAEERAGEGDLFLNS
ncbi:class I SAM-dependent methyltransferase [uncultured Cohaesibacter sp.]|uniref:class I SAM-dependent methyltransferase n=1 Tax=uncultured Cohaesibacter sp. TaxID=1002546 RepID=UPI00292FC096|nr:class I SAM-dependent methyltransferase [uncultured Cohaesibacter sp.]